MTSLMGFLSSEDCPSDARGAFKDNAAYDAQGGSVEMAEKFIQACRILLIDLPAMADQANRHRIQMYIQGVENAMQRAQDWLKSKRRQETGGGLTFSSFENFRG